MQLLLLSLPQTALIPGLAMLQQLQPLPKGILLPLQCLHPLQLKRQGARADSLYSRAIGHAWLHCVVGFTVWSLTMSSDWPLRTCRASKSRGLELEL